MARNRRSKIIRLPISKQIDINYRNYALYVLEKRGIPSWSDGLTNVQRLILLNTPSSFNKTLTVTGACIKDGYHHGDRSLNGAINKLAKSFGCAEPMLIGDGFFGSPVNTEAAAGRYTAIKSNPTFANIIKENHFLNNKNDEEAWNPLWVKYPIGLVTSIVGIAVGYKTTVLPRKLEDIKDYYEGKIKQVLPYFRDFTGTVERYDNMDKTWLISGDVTVNDKKQEIVINDMPPLIKYASFLKKLDKIIETYGRCKIANKSSMKVNMILTFQGHKQEWPKFKDSIVKATKILVTETPVFIKDGIVIQYEKIEDYLDDFKYRQSQLELERTKYFLTQTDWELEFNRAKKMYLEFMLEKKRKDSEIDTFLNKFHKNISTRLNGILLRHLSAEELKRTIDKIKELEKKQKDLQKQVTRLEKSFAKLKDIAMTRGVKNKASKDLFDSVETINGIDVFVGDDTDDTDEEFNPDTYE